MKIQEEKRNTNIMGILKSKLTVGLVGGALVFVIGFGIGDNYASVSINEKKVTYDDLVEEIEKKELELSAIKKDIEKRTEENEAILAEVNENQDAFDEAMKIINNKTELLEEIKSLDEQISSKKSELETIIADIQAKQSELATVSGLIKEKEEAPKQLSAGQFIVGKDIPPGRYKVVPIGRGSNFVVYDSSGQLFVNTIISNTPNHGVTEYVTSLDDGYVIDSATPAKYIPVE